MRYSIDKLLQKTEYYKSIFPGFPFEKVFIGERYDENMRARIHRLKFVHNYVDRVYFEEIFAAIQEKYPYTPDIIVYPPISFWDRIFRGPNHAKVLAESVRVHVPILCPFQKKFFSSHQARKKKKERNNANDYSLNKKYMSLLRGKSILFIDDIITTGNTANGLGRLLKKAGVGEIIGYFLASEKVSL